MFLKPLLAGALLLISSLACGSNGDKAQNIKEKIGESVYNLAIGDSGVGTGFVVETARGKKVIVSNAHVCDAAEENFMTAISTNGYKQKVKIISKSILSDLCALQAPVRSKPLKLARKAYIDENVYAVGYPLGKWLVVSSGELKGFDDILVADGTPVDDCTKPKHKVESTISVEDINDIRQTTMHEWCEIAIKGYHTTIPIDEGFSGSPMVNDDGKVVGVIMAYKGNISWGLAVGLRDLRYYLGYKNKK